MKTSSYRQFPVLAALALLGSVASSVGRAAPYLYDAAGDARAQKVKEGLGKIDLSKDPKGVRDTVDLLRKEQLAALEDNFAKQRDERLVEILNPASPDPLEKRVFLRVSERLAELLDGLALTEDQKKNWTWTQVAQRRNELTALTKPAKAQAAALAALQANFEKLFGVTPPDYDGTAFDAEIGRDKSDQPITKRSQLTKAVEDHAEVAAQWVDAYGKAYNRLHDRQRARLAALNKAGAVGALFAALELERELLKTQRTEARASAAAFAAQEKAYQELAETASGRKNTEELAKLQKQAEGLAKAFADAPDLVKEKLLPKRIAEIDVLLTSFATGQAPADGVVKDESLRKAAILSAALPSLLADAGKLAAGPSRPELTKLVFERALATAELNAARAEIRRRESLILHRQERLDALLSEVEQYQTMTEVWLEMRRAGGLAEDNGSPWNVTYAEVRSGPKSSEADKAKAGDEVRRLRIAQLESFHEVVADALLAVRRDQQAASAAELERIFVYYEGAIDRADNAIALWNTLLAEPINQLTAYYAAGIKPAEAAGLATQLIGLGAIAWRVK